MINNQSVMSDKSTTNPEFQDTDMARKETLKNIKVYVPAENYDKKLSFEQNLAEGRVKLFSEMPANNIKDDDDLESCISFPLVQKQIVNSVQQNTSSSVDFDRIANPSLLQLQTDPNNSAISGGSECSGSDFKLQNYENDKLHVCDVCDESFSRRRDLALHYLKHTEKEKRKAAKTLKRGCELCGKKIKQCHCRDNIKMIYPKYNNMPDYISISRPLTSSTVFIQAESISGKSSLVTRELYHCPECEQTFGLESQLKQHALVHKRERARMKCCKFCGKQFDDKENLTQHLSSDHPDKIQSVSKRKSRKSQDSLPIVLQPQVCTSCHTIFNNTEQLEKHLKRLGWVCILCHTYFCLKSDFDTHYVTHFTSKTVESNSVPSTNNSEKLTSNVYKKFSGYYSCVICDKNFKYRCLLKVHILSHSPPIYYSCKRCKKKFRQKINAYVHFFCHKKNKNVCQVCRKQFLMRKSLKLHYKIHLK